MIRSAMTNLPHDFEQAAEDVKLLSVRPDNDTLLKLYALYKQAAVGDLQQAQPGFFDFVGTAKHDAWAALAGMGKQEAMRRYVDLVQQLRA